MNKRNVQKQLREIRKLLYRLNDNGSIRSGNVSDSVEALTEAIRMVGEHRENRLKKEDVRSHEYLNTQYGPHGDKLW